MVERMVERNGIRFVQGWYHENSGHLWRQAEFASERLVCERCGILSSYCAVGRD